MPSTVPETINGCIHWTITHGQESEVRLHLLIDSTVPCLDLRITKEDFVRQTEEFIETSLTRADIRSLAEKLMQISQSLASVDPHTFHRD